MLFKGPFNKIVRSHEALILGLLCGILIGVIAMLMVNIKVLQDNLSVPTKLCGTQVNVESASYSYRGKITTVKCKDKRVFDNF